MMKAMKYILFGGAAAAGVYWFATAFSGNLIFDWKGLGRMKRDGLKLKVNLKYSVTNNNDVKAVVSKFVGTLKYGEHKLNDLNINSPITIAPGKTEDVDVLFTISPAGLLGEILLFFDNKEGFKKFKLKGWVSGKVGEVPFKTPIDTVLSLAE